MDPPLSARCCKFFGSLASQNLCSKCYKDYLEEENRAVATNNYVLALPAPSRNNKFPGSEAAKNSGDAVNTSPPSTFKNRCQCCNKKVGMMGFGCRCGGMFCGIHRYPEEHACKFDFKNVACVILAKENPVCKADKLEYRV